MADVAGELPAGLAGVRERGGRPGAARGETPESLLAKLQSLEKEFGRKPKPERNAPRPLDLDLIAFGGETRATPELTLPHPRVAQRRFVLLPLSEIAPDLVLPGEKLTVDELFDRLPVKDSVEWLASPA